MKRVRNVIIIFLGLIGVIIYGVRVKAVNSDLDLSEIKVYEKGEIVPYEKDFTESSVFRCEGYSVQVLDSQIYNKKEFLDKFKVNNEVKNNYDYFKYFYAIDIRVYNKNDYLDEEHGINIWNIHLKSVNDYYLPETDLNVKINSLPGIGFSLRPESDMDLTLIYALSDVEYKDISEIENTKFMLVITEYPVMKLLEIE